MQKESTECCKKIYPLNCLIYLDDFTSCPPNCFHYRPGEAIIPHLHPTKKIDCVFMERHPDSFMCIEKGLINEDINCSNCLAYKRRLAITDLLEQDERIYRIQKYTSKSLKAKLGDFFSLVLGKFKNLFRDPDEDEDFWFPTFPLSRPPDSPG